MLLRDSEIYLLSGVNLRNLRVAKQIGVDNIVYYDIKMMPMQSKIFAPRSEERQEEIDRS